jgi:hypothetical protein
MLQVEEAAVVGFELVVALGLNLALEVVDGYPSCYQDEVEGQLRLETEDWLLHQCMIADLTAAKWVM